MKDKLNCVSLFADQHLDPAGDESECLASGIHSPQTRNLIFGGCAPPNPLLPSLSLLLDGISDRHTVMCLCRRGLKSKIRTILSTQESPAPNTEPGPGSGSRGTHLMHPE